MKKADVNFVIVFVILALIGAGVQIMSHMAGPSEEYAAEVASHDEAQVGETHEVTVEADHGAPVEDAGESHTAKSEH